ncbi:MAG TPA: hypothetical protein VFZ34_14035, partial [Blastocatellia bacterium]|nr:hypothetical protein [Blastocatellia bacterium]
MTNSNFILRLICTLCLVLGVNAQQTSDDAEKAKQGTEKKALALVEQILTEAQSLKLPENRVRIKAMAAGMLWEKDQTRARTYFQEAENDLKQMIQALGYEQNNRERKVEMFNQFRQELLRNLSQLDPQLALDLLRATKLPEEYKRQYGNYDPEIQLEAELSARAASRDPAKALKTAEELLQKGYSFQILSLADSIRWDEKSRPAVTEIYKKLISKLATDDFLGNTEAVGIAERLLQQANGEAMMRARVAQAAQASNARQPQTVIDDQMFRELIEATAKAAVKPSNDRMRMDGASRLRGTLQSMQPSVEKYAPAQSAALRTQPSANVPKGTGVTAGPNPGTFNEFRTLANNPSATNEQLLDFARKAAPQEQNALYQQIAFRALNKGETEQAKQIIETYVKDSRIKEDFERMRDSIAMNNAMQ